jgi:sterol desaturase/sphingolipid hydroxylase (fatty acid hydroxylase superfamily)
MATDMGPRDGGVLCVECAQQVRRFTHVSGRQHLRRRTSVPRSVAASRLAVEASVEFEHAKLVISVILVGFVALEFALGRFLHKAHTTRKDVILDVGSTLMLPVLVVPTVFTCAGLLVAWIAPGSQGALSHWPWWLMFGVLLLVDDLTQYGWHRLSHSSFLYPLHRAHHSASYLSVRIVYRNNLVYYALMPGLWLSGAAVFLGFGPVYIVYIVLKMLVIIGAHSSVPWDAPLYRNRWTARLMWVVERVISTPATHSAHHGLHEADGVTHYRGNYGNFLFLWDVIFRTAHITRRRPVSYGIEDEAPVSWFQELIWPLGSASAAAGVETGEPYSTQEEPRLGTKSGG